MKADHTRQSERADEALCTLAASGDRIAEEALVMRYHRLVRICARPYFLAGGDSEDLIQEGMVGLLAAIREYDSGKAASFRTFAEVCIKNRLISVIKAAARDKHIPLNNYVSFETPLFSGNGDHYAYGAADQLQEDPEAILLGREAFQERMRALEGQLSGFEASILRLYLNGLSYSEIAAEVNKSPKSVDNAVQRIRRKLAQHHSFGDFSES
ncbi:sigma-70 family RNA polymerase sigma factor [Flavonifractor sp. DFI.6.63]|uniref:RNA polymerase sigma factor SigS n=1 Tax=Lawsonibacter hominis TaxID=2763053 RepID=A0A8J6M8K2_9FIRM|nr:MULTISPECIES: sigma-70 family RNA polymerase sigma factor [Oscillospiraceae]MBS1385003.1 sigma-70 family RNA polymerase sigma factor [Flavonifractor sp.]MDU2194864.1 sigma-70 family RNA polymerase sigma factor [Clostridiales bacterium]MDY2977070.1 sigma-70 family RNA polymerase sigma factor [Oscillospiraceae bacterium]MBC5732590.1 sigma-70 family RNA polymerase sigma factor [Lawsonibacter hominis]MCI6397747.1 sigma-70 family RNA polymerase sigma factor [Lawsonibacter sp.]